MSDMQTEIERIRAFLKRTGMTQIMLARQADLHPNTIVGITSEHWKPTPKSVRALVRAIDRLEQAFV